MVALRSLDPEDRDEMLAELRKTIADREQYEHHLARLEREQAPKSYRGKLRAQIRACERHEARFKAKLKEAA